jgi:hypothetical protein
VVLATAEVDAGDPGVVIPLATAGRVDGALSLTARATGEAGTQVVSDPVDVVVDNTAPAVAFAESLPRFSVLAGEASLELDIDEPHVARVRVLAGETEIHASDGPLTSVTWDTSVTDDGIHFLGLEVTDVAGRTATVSEHLVIVANNGEERPAVDAVATIPENYLEVDYHVRASFTGAEGVREIIAWMTWDPTGSWAFELAVGQGLCPHRGVEYLAETSDQGEIVITLAREELAPWIVPRLPVEDQDSDVFPYNGDPLTFGAFFGHVDPLDPAAHVGSSMPVTLGMVLLYAP